VIKRKKLYKFGTRLSYLYKLSVMKRKKAYKNDAMLRINSLAYLSHDKKKKNLLESESELSYLSTWSGKRFTRMTQGQV
jgi:hypothetical protein